MAHCININSPEYIALAQQSKLGQRELKARIATWQEINNNYERFPSIEEVEGIFNSQVQIPFEEFKEDEYLAEILPNIDNLSIKESINNIKYNGKSDELVNIGKNLNYMNSNSSIEKEYVNSFNQVFNALTSEEEKNSIFKKVAKEGKFFETLAEMYDDYISYPQGYIGEYGAEIVKVFDRMINTMNALNEKGSLIQNYLRESNTINNNKYLNDLRVYEKETNRRIIVQHKGKSPSQIQGAIKHATGILQRSYSNMIQIKVSEDKTTKNGTQTIVYITKPKIEDYVSNNIMNGNRIGLSDNSIEQLLENRRNLFYKNGRETTAREILERMDDNVSKSLLKYLPNEDIRIFYTDSLTIEDYTNEDGSKSWVEANYIHDTGDINISLSGMYPETIKHEIVHALTIDYIRRNPEAKTVKEFKKIYEYAKEQLGKEGHYGLTNLYEFASESISRRTFKDRMKEIESSDRKHRNLFQQVIDKILEFFGIRQSNKTLYNEAFSTTADLIRENYEYLTTQDKMLKDQIDSLTELDEFNNVFSSVASSQPINSPYTQSLKKLNAIYSLQEIKDLSSTINSAFVDLVSWYHEKNTDLTREEVISWITPQRLFKETKEQFEIDLEEYIEDKVNQKYIDNMQKLLDNFNDLAMMATPELNFIEGLKFNQNDLETFRYDLKEELDSGASQSTEIDNEVEFHENSVLDGWMRNFKFTSVNDSLTNKVKRVLRSIDELDKKGNPVINSVGYPRKISLDIIKNDLLNNMQTMITSKDMLPALGVMSKEKPWVTSIINHLQDDNELTSQFYSVFKKDFTKHSIITTVENSDETIGYKSPVINQSNDLNLWIEDWRNTLENGVVFNSNYSIYNPDGTLNLKNIEGNIKILQDLIKEWNAITKQNDSALRKDFLSRKAVTIKNQLNAVGIGLSSLDIKDLLLDALVDTNELKEMFGVEKSSFNIDTILNKLVLTNSWAKNNIKKEGVNALSVIQENNSNYSTIARLVANTFEDLVEGSVHENGKSYYTYLQPSYLSKITKQLKNVRGNNKEFNEFIDKEFKQYVGTIYNEDGTFNISWLNDLTDRRTGASKRELFDHKVVLNFNKTDYDSLNPADYQSMLLVEYFTGTDTAWYHVPILAEAPSAEFIKFDKVSLNFKDNISERLLDLFTYEYNRIKTVRARKESIANGSVQSINNFDNNGEKFHFLSFFNEHLQTIDDIVNKNGDMAQVLPSELFNFVKDVIIQNLDLKADKAIDYMNELGLLEKTNNNRYKYLHSLGINENNMRDKLEEYFYNSYFATANIIQLTSTDLAYYKNVEDFQKRNKEIHAPGTMVNTGAMYNGERIGKDIETYIILKDQEQASTKEVQDYIKKIFDNNPLLSKVEKEAIFEKYYNNNITDAQAYRSLDSAKTVIAMSTGWNDKLEASYQRLKKGEWDIADYDNIMQAFKPFVYTQTSVDSGILLDSNDPSKGNRMIKVPVQHKNSEAILLPMIGMQFNSPKLRGIMQAMSENSIDVVMFDSAVKVGLQGVLDINEMNDRRQIANYIKSFKDNNQVFKTISYEDYKIQQPIPEHLQDTSQLFGTQLRKLVISDIAMDAIFNINGKTLNKEQLQKLYNNTIIENIIDSYEGLIEEFGSVEKLQSIIENELINNSRYSKDLLNACQLDTNKKFVLPLFDPSQSGRIQQLLNSIWKSRVTKQRIKGGKAVQMSSFGLSDTLELKFHEVDGKPAIEYMECYLPFWSEKMPKNWESSGFIDKETGIMDVNKMLAEGIIDEEFLDAIAYRIPTEDKYSMWPLRVKGFLPRNGGGNIILPREITTITGSDFDIDSMYMMLKEFNFDEQTGKFKTIKPDMNKDVKDMNLQQRNNLLIDIMRGVLSHPDTASKQLNPGNFDGPKMTARRLNILASGANYSWSQLESMSLSELDKISEKNQLDILDFTTQVQLHKQNMTAAKLIGIIANHSTNHAVRQNTEIEVNPVEVLTTNKETKEKKIQIFDRFKLNGRFLTSLHDIINPTGTAYISKNYASFLAASVDAVKDPVLSFFNLNTFTADSAMLLTGLGYNFDEIGLLLRQPIIEELVAYHDRNSKSGMTKTQAVEELLRKYKSFLVETLNTPVYSNLFEANSNNFTSDRMADQISLNAKLKEMNTYEGIEREAYIRNNYGEVQDLYKYQYQVLLNYKNILDTAQKLADFVSASRADTGGGGAGPTIADTKFKMRKILKNIENSNPQFDKPVLANADVIDFVPTELLGDIDKLRDFLRSSKLGFIQGFTTLGLQATEKSLSQYFPHYSSYFDYIFNQLEDNYLKSNKLSVELMNQLYNEFFAYYMSQFDEFSREGSNEFVREFPNKFLEMKNKDDELSNLQIIKNIKYINPSLEVPVPKLKFRSGGRLSSNVRDTMIMEWESMLYQPKYRDLAIDLFKYNYFVNGFSFGTTSFMHLAPAALKMNIPNFTDNLYKLMDKEGGTENNRFTQSQLDIFIDQFYRNHLGSRKLVPELKSLPSEMFTNEDGSIKDDVTAVIDREEILDLFTSNGSTLPYVMINIKGNQEYFKVFRNSVDDADRIITEFQHIQPLGIRNNFLEYEFDNADITSNITNEDYSNASNRDEYRDYNYDVTQSQDAYEYDYNPEPADMQEMPEHLREQFDNAFQFIQEQNDGFKGQKQQAFEALTEDDAPAFVREYNQTDNDITNPPDTSDAFQSLVDEVGKEQIDKYKENC